MKITFQRALLGAFLTSGALGLSIGEAHAAEPGNSIPAVTVPKSNGFDSFVEAGRIYLGGIEGLPMAKQTMSPQENLKAQRECVARNAKTLKLVREGLAMTVVNPPATPDVPSPDYDKIRVLARLLMQEASVRIASGDFNGSVNSQLDAIEMGVDITRGGGLQAAEVGLSIEALSHLGITGFLSRLTPEESLQAAARLAKIEALRPPLGDFLRTEKTRALQFTQYSMEKRDWERVLNGQPDEVPVDPTAMPDAGGGAGGEGEMQRGGAPAPVADAPQSPFTPQEIDQLRNVGITELETNIARYYDVLVTNAASPYGATKVRVVPAADPWSRLLTQNISEPSIRLSYEAARTQNLLLGQALTLGAAKINKGKYPATVAAPFDPFRPAQPLIYKPNGQTYLLYSVGPDGKDDGGTPAAFTPFKRDDEPAAAMSGLDPKTTGDVVAPVL